MKVFPLALLFTAVCFSQTGRQSVARGQPKVASLDEIGIAQYPQGTYSQELTQRLLEKKFSTWLVARVYRTDDSIKDVNKYFRSQAQKHAIESPGPMLKALLDDNWDLEKNDLRYSPRIFGAGVALRASNPSARVEYAFGVIPLTDSAVRIHLTSPYPSAAYDNRLVEGTMIIMIREQLTQEIAPDNEKAYSGQEVTRKVRVKSKPHPEYAMAGVGGTVVLRAVLSASGKVTNIRVISDLPGFTEAAIKAARKITFQPAIKDGRYVSQHIQLEYNFCP